jgi:hypothetical protein
MLPKQGSLVVVSHWGSFSINDGNVFLGYFSHYEDGYFYICGSKRGFKHCRKVSRQEIKVAGFTSGNSQTLCRNKKGFLYKYFATEEL